MHHLGRKIYRWQLILVLSLIFFAGVIKVSLAQEIILNPPSINILANSVIIENASSGGMYAPQFSPFDIDNDQRDEIIVFDRFSELFGILKWNTEDKSYQYEYNIEVRWPRVNSWALIRDYNNDGIGDIFTQGEHGIAVWKGDIEAGIWSFSRVTGPQFLDDSLIFKSEDGSTTNIYHAASDIPVIEDLDNDGDLDILTFELSGSYLYLYECMSDDSGLALDYKLSDKCWGKFVENGNTNGVKLSQTPAFCPLPFTTRHAGSSNCLIDIDQDSIPDLLLGDKGYPTLRVLYNGNTADSGFITHQDNVFPAFSEPAYIYDFPAAYKLDVNLDSINDVVVANNGSVDYDNDGLFLYEGTNEEEKAFKWVTSNWLFEQFFDLGRFSAPLFMNIDGDQRTDILVAYNLANDQSQSVNRLAFLKNEGMDTENGQILYSLKDANFLKLGERIESGIRPVLTSGDIDNDGDMDLVIGMSNGDIHMLKNGSGEPHRFEFESFERDWQGFVVGSGAAPELFDIDGDGLLDLLVGEDQGEINFFKNLGTREVALFEPDPTYYPNAERLGNIRISSPASVLGRSIPRIVQKNGDNILSVGSYSGDLHSFKINLEDLYFSTFEEIELFGGLFMGKNSNFSVLYSEGEKTKIVTGNIAGGLQFFDTDVLTNSNYIDYVGEEITVFPNPSHNGSIQFEWNNMVDRGNITIYNTMGKIIDQNAFNTHSFTIDIENWHSGVYFAVIRFSNGENRSCKFIVQ